MPYLALPHCICQVPRQELFLYITRNRASRQHARNRLASAEGWHDRQITETFPIFVLSKGQMTSIAAQHSQHDARLQSQH